MNATGTAELVATLPLAETELRLLQQVTDVELLNQGSSDKSREAIETNLERADWSAKSVVLCELKR